MRVKPRFNPKATIHLVTYYDCSKNDLSLDEELEIVVGQRHQHSGVFFPTMERNLTWLFENEDDARLACDKLVQHSQVLRCSVT